MQFPDNRFTNQEGMELLDKLKAVGESLSRLEADQSRLQNNLSRTERSLKRLMRSMAPLARPRLRVLEEWGFGERSQATVDTDSQTVDGGDMVSDIGAILFSKEEGSARVDEYTAAFKDAYGIGFRRAKRYSPRFVGQQSWEKLVMTCNIHATVKKTKSWRNAANRDQIILLASKIIQDVRRTDASKRWTCFHQGEIKEDFEKLLSMCSPS